MTRPGPIPIRLSEREREALQNAADNSGVTLSAWIRDAAVGIASGGLVVYVLLVRTASGESVVEGVFRTRASAMCAAEEVAGRSISWKTSEIVSVSDSGGWRICPRGLEC